MTIKYYKSIDIQLHSWKMIPWDIYIYIAATRMEYDWGYQWTDGIFSWDILFGICDSP